MIVVIAEQQITEFVSLALPKSLKILCYFILSRSFPDSIMFFSNSVSRLAVESFFLRHETENAAFPGIPNP
jgi:hypothetical protein